MSHTKGKQNSRKQQAVRKRVNRMKSFIIFCAVALLLTSVVMNFVLVFKVLHLESKLNALYSDCYPQVIQTRQLVS